MIIISSPTLFILFIRNLIGDKYDRANQMTDQELMKTITTDNQQEVNSKILKAYDEKKEMIVFSHSQGNFYANKACEDLGKSVFKNIQIATPTSEINYIRDWARGTINKKYPQSLTYGSR